MGRRHSNRLCLRRVHRFDAFQIALMLDGEPISLVVMLTSATGWHLHPRKSYSDARKTEMLCTTVDVYKSI